MIPVIGGTTIGVILSWHNLLRDSVASGRHHMKIPLAADMREMVPAFDNHQLRCSDIINMNTVPNHRK